MSTNQPKEELIRQFENLWQQTPTWYVVAPGRVNLIGEHTDYNDGFVLPCAIDFAVRVLAAPNNSNHMRVAATDFDGQHDVFEFQEGGDIPHHSQWGWANYVRGVVHVMAEHHREPLCGLDILIDGDVPMGAGLSSSAALEVAIAKTLQVTAQLDVNDQQLAQIAQRAENTFVGCQCGIMDQLASALGREHHAMLLDCRSLDTQFFTLPKDIHIVIIHSNVQRGLVDSEYNTRRQQCEQAANHLGVSALRDASLLQLQNAEASMDATVFKRARHVITENSRTTEAAHALSQGDIETLSTLMRASHHSMRDDFEITVPAIDTLVELIDEVVGQRGGVRMTGGGFGGCVVALVPSELVEVVKAHVAEHYHAQTGLNERVFLCSAKEGVHATPL